MRYDNFSIRFSASNDHTFALNVSSPAGECRGSAEIPKEYIDEINDVMREVGGNIRGLGRKRERKVERDTLSPVAVGKRLFDAVFQGAVLDQYHRSVGLTRAKGKGLRIRLVLDPSEPSLATLGRLPWELICDEGSRDAFLATSNHTPVVRYLEVPKPHEPLEFKLPFRVLVAMSNPTGVAPLDLERERKRIQENWGSRSDVEVEYLQSTTREALLRRLRDSDYHALHFMGHGDFDQKTGEGVVILENDDSTPDHVSGADFGAMIQDESSLRLVFLNACNTAQSTDRDDLDPFAGVASSLVMSGIPAVIAMQFPITDEAAIRFSNCVYEQLPNCLPLDYIVSEARKEVSQTLKDRLEWATPALFMRSKDGIIYESAYRSVVPLDRKEAEDYQRLSSKMRQAWIDGKLDRDIPMKPPIELDKMLIPRKVQRGIKADDQGMVPVRKAIGTLFDEYDRSLLILGQAGHGKTIALLALAQHLFDRFERDADQPIPVVLDVTTWPDSELSILDWAAREVFEIHHVSDNLFREWIRSGRIVLLLDALDALDDLEVKRCLDAIGEFADEKIRGCGFHGVALCCRSNKYPKSSGRERFQGIIELQPLTEPQIRLYIQRCGENMAGLQACLDRDPQLLEDARTPLMLGMMSIAYGLNPDKFDITTANLEDSTNWRERKSLITQAYLNRVFEDVPGDALDEDERQIESDEPARRVGDFSQREILDGLSWLAKGMKDHHQSIFLIESLQPNWLPTRFHQVLSHLVYSVATGLLVATALWLIWTVSVFLDPPTIAHLEKTEERAVYIPAWEALRSHPWWFAVVPAFVFALSMWEIFQRKVFARLFNRPSERLKQFYYDHAYYFALYLSGVLIWLALWCIPFQLDARNPYWMAHPFQMAFAVPVLFAFRATPPSTSNYLGTKEKRTWSWKFALMGAIGGLLLGMVLGIATAVSQSHARWGFFLPIWCVACTLFTGYRLRPAKNKHRPNEGILLSQENALWTGLKVGGIVGLTLYGTLLVVFPFWVRRGPEKDYIDSTMAGSVSHILFPYWHYRGTDHGVICLEYFQQSMLENALHKLSPVLGLTIGCVMIAALWFGGLDVIRHYSLRLIMSLTDRVPLRLSNFCNQAAKHILLQPIGGGFIFRNHLIREHFEALPRQNPKRDA